MIIDTHSHLNFKAFDKDREVIIKKCLNSVIVINIGSNYLTSEKAVQISQKGIYATVGLHPIHVKKEEFDFKKYKELAKNKYVVAIGETGLDLLGKSDLKEQKDVFFQHFKLAKELNLPLILHCRKFHEEFLKILPDSVSGVLHCYTGTLKQAKEYLKKGLYLGFNGIIFKLSLDKVIKQIPLERMLAETDCPYLGEAERNDPFFVQKVIQKIAELKGLDYSLTEKTLFNNAKSLFKI